MGRETVPVADSASCSLCDRILNPGEPLYPVTIEGADLEVCVGCASRLSRDGVGAWCWPVTEPRHRR
jgi:ribosome-binding protein aMBF1 (putative translation factor)